MMATKSDTVVIVEVKGESKRGGKTTMNNRKNRVEKGGTTKIRTMSSILCDKHTYVRTYIHTYIHTYMHTYIHTNIHIYIRAYVHTYVRTYRF